MDEMYGLQQTTAAMTTTEYSDKALMSPENLILSSEYQAFLSSSSSAAAAAFRDRLPIFGSEEFLTAASACISEAASMSTPDFQREEDFSCRLIKARIASHPTYPRLLQAYIDCQKVGAPPEIASFLEEIRRKHEFYKRDSIISTCLGADPELDEFMVPPPYL